MSWPEKKKTKNKEAGPGHPGAEGRDWGQHLRGMWVGAHDGHRQSWPPLPSSPPLGRVTGLAWERLRPLPAATGPEGGTHRGRPLPHQPQALVPRDKNRLLDRPPGL